MCMSWNLMVARFALAVLVAGRHMCENAGCCWDASLGEGKAKCYEPTGWGGQLGLDLTKGSANINYEALKNLSPAFTFLYTITATENKPGGGGRATSAALTNAVDDLNARMYGLPYDFDSSETWQMSTWNDERPKAGLLSSAEVWRRFESDGSNFHRGRANMVARELLCEDFDTRDILVAGGIDIADEFEVANAVQNVDACIGCHQALDPLAAYFWGYMQLVHRNAVRDAILGDCAPFDYADGNDPPYGPNHLPEYFCYPIKQYSAFMEDEWEFWQLRPPSYYGKPAKDLRDVGFLIAEDPRFSQCMARQFYG